MSLFLADASWPEAVNKHSESIALCCLLIYSFKFNHRSFTFPGRKSAALRKYSTLVKRTRRFLQYTVEYWTRCWHDKWQPYDARNDANAKRMYFLLIEDKHSKKTEYFEILSFHHLLLNVFVLRELFFE